MNTQDYINELKNQLRKLPDEDREDAISYYFEYLADAGPDGAAEAMEKLGPPSALAAGIRADQAMLDLEDEQVSKGGQPVRHGVRAVWLAGLAAVPRNILAVFVTVIIIIVFFAVMIALFATSVGLIGGGGVGLVAGIIFFASDLPSALFYAGTSVVAISGGFLLFIFSTWCSKHLLHAIASVFNKIRHKRAKKQNRDQENYRQETFAQQTYEGDISEQTRNNPAAETPDANGKEKTS